MLEQNARLNMSASIDPLTGLLNRRGVTEAIGRLIAINEGQKACIFIGDLDHLKQINDTFGHGEGDFAINAAGQLLRRVVGDESPLGRIGGDEFLGVFLIDDDLDAEEEVKRRVSDVKLSAEIFNTVSGKPYYLGVSVGAHIFTCNSGTAIKELMKYADEELYVAKKSRRASVARETVESTGAFDIDEALFEDLDGEDDE
jgi:diguanylate cyclase (GGDEF)-like protein